MTASDNDRCISLRGHGWLPKFLQQRLGMPVYAPRPLTLQPIFRITQALALQIPLRRQQSFRCVRCHQLCSTTPAVDFSTEILLFMVDIRYTTAAAVGNLLLSCSVTSRAALAMPPQIGEPVNTSAKPVSSNTKTLSCNTKHLTN